MSCDPLVRHELQIIYTDLQHDVAAAGPVCEISGRCCRFQEYGHTLFLSSLEAELLLEAGLPAEAPVTSDVCPFQQGKLCTARERRPLGCRIFFCDPAYQARAVELSEQYVARLKQLANRLGREWLYVPLHTLLAKFQTSLPV